MRQQSIGQAAAFVAAIVFATAAESGNPLVELPEDYASTPANSYSRLDADGCFQMLDDRTIPFEHASAGPLVEAPVRLVGPLNGVAFKHVHARASGAVLDCRLLLALDDFSQLLRTHHITELGFVAAFRPDRSGKAKAGQRHPAGLAMDIAWFGLEGGRKLVVDRDYDGRVGSKTCGLRAQKPSAGNAQAAALRNLVCETGKARLFNLFLTPNYDPDHHDHVHVEVRRNTHWFLVQ